MSDRLTFNAFLSTAPGELLQEWERAAYAEETADVFGAAALQIGMPQIDTLAENRMQSHWLIESVDLVTLPHALDFTTRPQQVLREAVRVLEPEGRLILTAFNAMGLWWLRQQSVKLGLRPYLPSDLAPISFYRLRDWLSLLGLEVDGGRFGIYAPALRTLKRLKAWSWLDKAGDRWAPQFSNVILLSAVKRTPGPCIVNCEALRKLSDAVPATGVPAAASSATTLKNNTTTCPTPPPRTPERTRSGPTARARRTPASAAGAPTSTGASTRSSSTTGRNSPPTTKWSSRP